MVYVRSHRLESMADNRWNLQHPDATKQGAVQAAAKTALKMYMKSEMGGSGGHGGGQSSGGGLMGMASQFMR